MLGRAAACASNRRRVGTFRRRRRIAAQVGDITVGGVRGVNINITVIDVGGLRIAAWRVALGTSRVDQVRRLSYTHCHEHDTVNNSLLSPRMSSIAGASSRAHRRVRASLGVAWTSRRGRAHVAGGRQRGSRAPPRARRRERASSTAAWTSRRGHCGVGARTSRRRRQWPSRSRAAESRAVADRGRQHLLDRGRIVKSAFSQRTRCRRERPGRRGVGRARVAGISGAWWAGRRRHHRAGPTRDKRVTVENGRRRVKQH